jgi:transposase InsO family protein
MAEAFVHTFRRNYVQVNPLPDAEAVLKSIGSRIEDHNENHPHSALKWRSPREFRRAQTETA